MLSDRQRVSTGNPWESSVGFSRAIRTGNLVFTAGTIASDEHGVVHGGDSYEQCCYIFDKLAAVLARLGSSLEHVVRVVCYLTGMEHAEGFSRAHHEHFSASLPAATCVCVSGLFGEGSVAEIELVAVVPEAGQD
jgi:enamine deaminase RidA (YjgF/YER057c/UK114 family)